MRVLLCCLGALSLLGCSTKIIVESDPPGADVYYSAAGSSEQKRLGKTPLVLDRGQLERIHSSRCHLITDIRVSCKKGGYEQQKIMIPVSRLGVTETAVNFKLIAGNVEANKASLLLKHYITAQRYINQNSFDQAQEEIDKALLVDANFARGLSMKGTIYFLQARYQQSLTWFKKAITADPAMEDVNDMIFKTQEKIRGVASDEQPKKKKKKKKINDD